MRIAFAGQPLDRADPVRTDTERLAALRGGDALLLRLDGLLPVMEDGTALAFAPIAEAAPEAELVFLGLRGGRALFAAVPTEGDPDPA